MNFALCLALTQILMTMAATPANRRPRGYKSSAAWLPREPVIRTPTGEQLVSDVALPKQWDWRNVNGRNLVTSDANQHIDQYCGGCWIFGTTSALNDRIKVMRNGQFPDVMLARQVVVNCVPSADGKGPNPGCNGGDAWMIHRHMLHNKIPDETCQPYQARNMECVPMNICRNCVPPYMVDGVKFNTSCYPVKNYIGYGVSEYGSVSGELAMMKEIYSRGPIACSFATDDPFMFNYSENAARNGGVYLTDKKYTTADIDHVMEVVVWGETPTGVKYWVVRNSWGTYWGNVGWLKIRRGTDELLVESGGCDWAVPDFSELDAGLEGRVLGDYVQGIHPVIPSQIVPALELATSESGAKKQSPQAASFTLAAAAFCFGAVATLAGVGAVGGYRFLRGAVVPRQPSLLG